MHFIKLAKGLDKEKYPDYPAKDLPFSRVNQSTRSVTTHDLFAPHLEYLNEKDKQELCLFNLMTPGVFLEQALRVPNHADKWIDLVEKGLKFHTRGKKMEAGAFFSLTLSYYLTKYLGSHASRFKPELQRLQKLDKFIQENIELHRKAMADKSATKVDKDIAATMIKDLELLAFLRKSQALVNQEKWDMEDAKAVIRGLLYRNRPVAKRGHVLDLFMENELDSASQRLQSKVSWYLSHITPAEQEKLLREIVKEFLIPDVIPDDSFKIEGTAPIFVIKHWNTYSIDLTRGTIKTDKYIMRSVPTEFYTQDFIEFFGQREFQSQVLNSSATRQCEFNCDGKEYRINLDAKGKLHIQTQFGTSKKWFELQSKRELRSESDEKSSDAYKMIPRLFLEQGRYVWGEVAGVPNQYFFTDRAGNIAAELSRESGRHFTIEEYRSGEKTGYQLITMPTDSKGISIPDIYATYLEKITQIGGLAALGADLGVQKSGARSLFDLLQQVEDPNFLEIWEYGGSLISEKKIKINLPRYGLEFELVFENGVHRLKSLNYPGWYLLAQDLKSVQNCNQILYLINENTDERMALVPKQTFQPVSESMKDGEYYYLSLDTSNSIPEKALEKWEQGDWHWKHSNSAQMATFKLNASNQLIGTSQEEWLHIAYLHLAKHDTAKAIDALNNCIKLGGIRGTLEEIEWIKRIMSEIPDPYSKKDKLASKAKTNEPEVLAVRLRAAALLADYKNVTLDTPKFDLAEPETLAKRETYNERYQDLKKKELINFYSEDFDALANECYVNYYKVKGNLPENLILSTSLELSLLRQVFKKIPRTKAFGFVQGRWRELELVELRSEQTTLIKKKAQNGALSPQDEKRLQFLGEVLRRGNPYAISEAHLGSTTFALNPELTQFESNELTLLQPANVNTYKVERNYKPSELHPNMHPYHFLFSFKSLYQLAKTKENAGNAVERNTLKRFVDGWLTTWAGSTAPKMDKMTSLIILLKYVLENPESWPDYETTSALQSQRMLERITVRAQELARLKPYSISAIRKVSGPDISKQARIEAYEEELQILRAAEVKREIESKREANSISPCKNTLKRNQNSFWQMQRR